ncbi:MAG: tetratricopeptide repeat protein [Acidobacteriota bacterium]|nr:tetratricopeptide repeat protein [Acidobacteriota bacterium]
MKLATLLLLLSLPMARADDNETWSKAKSLYEQGKFAQAVPLFEESIRARPGWFAPYMMQGQCHIKMAQFDKALVQLQEALTLDAPDNYRGGIRYYIGQAYMGLKQWKNAAQVFTDLKPGAPSKHKPGLLINIASCHMALGKSNLNKDKQRAVDHFRKSVTYFDAALELNPANRKAARESAFQRGWAAFQVSLLEDEPALLEESVRALETYLARDPEARHVYKILIDMDFQMVKKKYKVDQNYRKALEHLDGFLANWPDDARMQHFKGQAHQGLKQFDLAIPAYERAIALKPEESKYHLSLGKGLIEAKRYPAAFKAMKKARDLGLEGNADVYTYTAYSLTQQKTGCFVQDIPLIEQALTVLKSAKGKVSGPGAEDIEKNLAVQVNNLNVLKENIATEDANHQATLENIRKLSRNISGNSTKLQRDTEKALTTNTPELQENIKNLRTLIRADKKDLKKEYDQIEGYLREAGRCGGAEVFKRIPELKAVLAARQP